MSSMSRSGTWILCCGLLVLSGSVPSPKTLTADELVALAPRFSLDDPQLRSWHLRGYCTNPFFVRFDVAFERPNHYSVFISDVKDATPYFLAVDGHLLLYDAINRRVVLGKPGGIRFSAVNSGEKGFVMRWLFGERLDSAEIDLRSFFIKLHDFRSTNEGNGKYVLTAVSDRGSLLTARIDVNRKCPYMHMEITPSGEARPILCFEQIAIDEDIATSAWAFPSEEAFGRRLPVIKFADWWKGTETTDWTPLLSPIFRSALSLPVLREKCEERLGTVDWARAKAEDAKPSAAIREIVSSARVPAS